MDQDLTQAAAAPQAVGSHGGASWSAWLPASSARRAWSWPEPGRVAKAKLAARAGVKARDAVTATVSRKSRPLTAMATA